MKRLIAAALALAACHAFGADSDWIEVSESAAMTSYIQRGSFVLQNNKAGKEIALVVGRDVSKSNVIDLGKWYVATADCVERQGTIVTLQINGSFRYENEFVFGAGSVAASKAEAICLAYTTYMDRREKKGI